MKYERSFCIPFDSVYADSGERSIFRPEPRSRACNKSGTRSFYNAPVRMTESGKCQ